MPSVPATIQRATSQSKASRRGSGGTIRRLGAGGSPASTDQGVIHDDLSGEGI
jgi:hypothetical protein